MKYETSVITMTLHWHNSQISILGKCVDDTPTETGLNKFITSKEKSNGVSVTRGPVYQIK